MPTTTVRAHFRTVNGVLRHIREHERFIPEIPVVSRKTRKRGKGGESLGLFDREAELRELQDLARLPGGSEISGRLLELAREIRI